MSPRNRGLSDRAHLASARPIGAGALAGKGRRSHGPRCPWIVCRPIASACLRSVRSDLLPWRHQSRARYAGILVRARRCFPILSFSPPLSAASSLRPLSRALVLDFLLRAVACLALCRLASSLLLWLSFPARVRPARHISPASFA